MGKKQNRKFIVAICAMCIAFLGVVGALVGVLAASTQTIGSNFNVSYDIGENVAIAIGAENRLAPETVQIDPNAWWAPSESLSQCACHHGLYAINANEAQDKNTSLNGGNISMASGDFVQVNFYFENLSDKPVEVTIDNYSQASENFWLEYDWGKIDEDLLWVTEEGKQEWLSSYGTFRIPLSANSIVVSSQRVYFSQATNESTGEQYKTATFQIPAGEIYRFSLTMGLKNSNYSASYEGNFAFKFAQPQV